MSTLTKGDYPGLIRWDLKRGQAFPKERNWKHERELTVQRFSVTGFEDGGGHTQGMQVASRSWDPPLSSHLLAFSKNARISVPQLQETEFCQGPHELGGKPWAPNEMSSKPCSYLDLSFMRPWAGNSIMPCLDFWPAEMWAKNECCSELISLWSHVTQQ